uniref:Farnesoic acid O-methyl transferase domain-containing protein n=1 Tax=Anopheles quadriannulatus TaxID=34691 RepID=A0A182XBZ3_ANOQN
MYNQWLRWGQLIIPLMLLVELLASTTDAPDDVPPVDCLEHTVTSGTFDQYYELAELGNEPSASYLVNVSFTVELGNRQEELAVLLSGQNRSYQHPDFARTYEMRMTNVYTVVYRETLKMQAYHSPLDKLFPADRFRLRFLLSRDGNLTVLVNEGRLGRRPLLAVVDERQALDVQYVSFSSRMNAYPVRFYLGCGLPQHRAQVEVMAGGAGEPASLPLTDGCPVCPVCPKQRCEVVVKACADSSKDANGAPTGEDPERQKYYFYFNLYLMKNRTKTNGLPTRTTSKQPQQDDGL